MSTFVGGRKKNPAANTNHKTFPKTPRHSGGRQLKKTKTRNKVERLRKNKSQGHLKQGWRYNQNTQTLLKPALKLWSQNRSRKLTNLKTVVSHLTSRRWSSSGVKNCRRQFMRNTTRAATSRRMRIIARYREEAKKKRETDSAKSCGVIHVVSCEPTGSDQTRETGGNTTKPYSTVQIPLKPWFSEGTRTITRVTSSKKIQTSTI